MELDRVKLYRIIKESDGKIENIVKRVDKYVDNVRAEAVGWAFADCCTTLDNGSDPRYKDMAKVLKRINTDLTNWSKKNEKEK